MAASRKLGRISAFRPIDRAIDIAEGKQDRDKQANRHPERFGRLADLTAGKPDEDRPGKADEYAEKSKEIGAAHLENMESSRVNTGDNVYMIPVYPEPRCGIADRVMRLGMA